MNTNIYEIGKKSTTRIKSIAMHPKQTTFITGHHCGMIYLWDLNYLSIIGLIGTHEGSVRCVAFHNSGNLFVSCGDDKIIRVWNYKTQTIICELRGHSQIVRSVCFHERRPWIVSGSDDCTVKLWDYENGEMLSSSSGHNHYVMSVIFLDDEHIGSGSMDQMINIWKIGEPEKRKSGKIIDRFNSFVMPNVVLYKSIEGHLKGINCLSMNRNMMISGGDDGEIKIWRWSCRDLTCIKSIGSDSCIISINDVSAISNKKNLNVFGVGSNGILKINSIELEGDNNITDDKIINYVNENSKNNFQNSIMNSDFSKGINLRCVENRLWAIGIYNNYIVVGSDDGLVIYRKKINTAGIRVKKNIFYISKKRIMCYNMEKKKAKELYNLDINVLRIHSGIKTSIIVEYQDIDKRTVNYIEYIVNKEEENNKDKGKKIKDEIFSKDIKNGQCGYINNVCYELKQNNLFRNGEKYLEGVDGTIIFTNYDFFILNGNTVRNKTNIFTLSFKPFNVVENEIEIAFIGCNKIRFYDKNMCFKSEIEELVEITGGFYENNNGFFIFIYGTLRNIKYVYKGIGILLSVEEYLKPIALYKDVLYFLDGNGIRCISVNITEIAFRKIVCDNGDITGFINQNNLPGISPLKYLIKYEKGVVALPYIDDVETKFEIFVTSGDFEKAYEICFDDKMYDKLAFSAMYSGNYEMAEICWRKIESIQNLFYLFLCTKQIEKISKLKDKNIYAAILCKDKISINKLLGFTVFNFIETKLDKLSMIKNNKKDFI